MENKNIIKENSEIHNKLILNSIKLEHNNIINNLAFKIYFNGCKLIKKLDYKINYKEGKITINKEIGDDFNANKNSIIEIEYNYYE